MLLKKIYIMLKQTILKLPDIPTLNANINEVKDEIPNIANLGITSALTAVVYLPITQTLVKSKRKSLIISIINVLLIENLISLQQKYLT